MDRVAAAVPAGAGLARRAHQILLMFAATMLVNGAAITTWLFPRQLADLGFPHDLVLWYTGLGVLASAAGVVALIGCLGVLLVSGIGDNVTRAVSVIWVNRRTPAAVRATVHSFLSQAETVGEILGGGTLAALARAAGLGATLLTAAGLLAGTGALAARSRAR